MTILEQELRSRLADELEAVGDVRSEGLRVAVKNVPRHLFIPEFFRPVTTPRGAAWEPIVAARAVERDEWMRLAYRNQTWVTQLDERIRPRDVGEAVTSGNPTSSSTLPGLVVAMLEDLGLSSDNNILEIGTGSGYSTALLCERLGSERVVSVEADPVIASEAAAAIRRAGYEPTLVTGDGLRGFAPRAPYDRVIATCSVRCIPTAWTEQAAPGAVVLTTISGWHYGSAYVRLTVRADGAARGEFLPDTYSFMLARPHLPPPASLADTRLLDKSKPRGARVTLDSLDDWTAGFIGQLASPDSQISAKKVGDGPMVDYLIDPLSGSSASLTPLSGKEYQVRETGPVALWSQIEEAIIAWQQAGRPGIEQFRIEVTSNSQRVYLPGHKPLSWELPCGQERRLPA